MIYDPYLLAPAPDPPPNPDPAPIADAGRDSWAYIGEVARLNGGNSHDPLGRPLTYSWLQTCGDPVPLDNSDTATPPSSPRW